MVKAYKTALADQLTPSDSENLLNTTVTPRVLIEKSKNVEVTYKGK